MGAPGTNPETDKERRYLFFYDVGYHHLVAELEVLLRIFGYVEEVASFTAVDKFYQPPTRTLPKSEEEKKEESESCGDCSGCSCSSTSSTHTTSVSSGTMSSGSVEGADETRAEERIVFGRKFKLQAGTSVKDYTIIYIGEEGRTLTNLVIHFNHNEFLRFSPKTSKLDKETLQVNRTLSKRYFLVEKTKDADIIGIVVGTLGVDKYLDIIEHLKLVIKDAGKKHYLLAVGKLNPAKLANFEHVDIFVLVACPENSLVDSKDFYKPIVTPFELEVALVKGKKWTGDFVTDFRHVLPGLAATDKEQEEEEEDSEGEDSPRFSLIDGKLKASKAQEAEATQGKELANVSTERGLVQVKSAAYHLSTREWKGLEQKLGETPVALAVEGRSGLPKGYTHEPSAKE
ncbi:Diphthamide biosynthesis protein 2 [Balamuthia mandrillaris]